MEDKKVVIPPPPKELRNMPPPPPAFRNEKGDDPKNAKTNDVNNKSVENQGQTVVSKTEQPQNLTENVKPDTKVEKVKNKPSGGLKTAFYWIGFVVSLAALGILIFMLVK